MSNIILAQQMLETLKRDFYQAWNGQSLCLAHIDLPTYCKKFGVSKEDIRAYCNTLTLMVPVYPTCFTCHLEWTSLRKYAEPINNGHIIDWVDSFTMWCGRDHDTMWYYQDADGSCSFDLETSFDGIDYLVSWDPTGKSTIATGINDNEVYKLIRTCTLEELPYNISQEELYKLIQESK